MEAMYSLLRAEAYIPLSSVVRSVAGEETGGKDVTRDFSLKPFEGVVMKEVCFDKFGIVLTLDLRLPSKAQRSRVDASGRFKFGSLVCFSTSRGFRCPAFGVVVNRNELGSKGTLLIRLDVDQAESIVSLYCSQLYFLQSALI